MTQQKPADEATKYCWDEVITADKGDTSTFKYWAEKGADLFYCNDFQQNMLQFAAMHHHFGIFEYLLEVKNSLIWSSDCSCNNIMHYIGFSIGDDYRMINLVSKYLDPLQCKQFLCQKSNGNTPLHYAIKHQNSSIFSQMKEIMHWGIINEALLNKSWEHHVILAFKKLCDEQKFRIDSIKLELSNYYQLLHSRQNVQNAQTALDRMLFSEHFEFRSTSDPSGTLLPLFGRKIKWDKESINTFRDDLWIILQENTVDASLYTDEFQYFASNFPNDLIGKIGSYLSPKSYILLYLTNKRINSVLSHPYTLTELCLTNQNMLQCALKFRRLTYLEIDIAKICDSWPIEEEQTKFDHIQTLRLNAAQDTTKEDLQRILFSGVIHFESVNTLIIRNLNIDWNSFCQYSYLFRNVQHLTLDTVKIYENHDSDQESDSDEEDDEEEEKVLYQGLEDTFPKLTSLKLSSNPSKKFCTQLLNLFGHKLSKISIGNQSIPSNVISKILNKELDILAMSFARLYSILILPNSKLLNLKKVKINYGMKRCSQTEISQVVDFLFARQLSMEYIQIRLENINEMRNISSKIANALIDSRHIKRDKSLKVRLSLLDLPDDKQEIRTNCLKIITAFTYYYKDNDWMLVIDSSSNAYSERDRDKLLSWEYMDMYSVFEGNGLWIANKHCKISRFSENII